MVAQLQQPATTAIHGATLASQRPPAEKSDYDLTKAIADFNDWQSAINLYKQNILIPLDNYYERKQPSGDYFQIQDQQGNPTVLQYVSPITRTYQDAACDYIRPEVLRIRCPEADNVAASVEDRSDTEGALRAIMRHHMTMRMGNILERVKFLTALRGMCFVQVTWLSGEDAAKSNKRYQVRWDPHDMMDCAWRTGEDGSIHSIIVYKKKLGTEIPLAWLSAVGKTDRSDEYEVLEYWDETSHGALINGEICLPLDLHGYTLDGDNVCPFIPFMHHPRMQRLGQVAPLSSGVSQRSVFMGTPLCESLLVDAIVDSTLTTLRLHAANRGRGAIVVKGAVLRDNVMQIDLDTGVIQLEDNPTSKAEWLAPPQMDAVYQGIHSRIMENIAAASASPQLMAGQPQSVSGTSAQHQTSFARARAESLAITLEEGWTAVMNLTVANIKSFTTASAADLSERGGTKLHIVRKETSDLTTSEPLFGYKGAGEREITAATVQDIVSVIVEVEPDTRTPHEVEVQQALALEKSNLVHWDYIRTEKLHVDNVQEIKDQLILQRMEIDPNNPWGQYRQAEAVFNALAPDLDDEGQMASLQQALDQRRQQTIMQMIQGQGQPQGGSGLPMPNGATPPQGVQPQSIQPPVAPGAPPAAPPAPPPNPFGAANPQMPPPANAMPPGAGPGGPQFQPPQFLAQQPMAPTQMPPPFARPGGF